MRTKNRADEGLIEIDGYCCLFARVSDWVRTQAKRLSFLLQIHFLEIVLLLIQSSRVTLLCVADDHELLADVATPFHRDQQLTNVLLYVVNG